MPTPAPAPDHPRAGPISSLQLQYTNAVDTGGGNQRIGISDITFDKC